MAESPFVPPKKPENGGSPMAAPDKLPPPTRLAKPRLQLRPLTEYPDDDDDDRLRIPRDMWPEGWDLQWVTTSVYGQPQIQHRARFERKGWEPIHSTDFDGMFAGKFAPEGHKGEIEVDGLVLMARPMEWSDRARKNDKARATQQVQIKESQVGGDLEGSVSLDTKHSSAVRYNKIRKSVERIQVPED